MKKFHVFSKAGADMGVYEADTIQQAILDMHREAGYGKDVVWLGDDGGLAFRDEEALRLCGNVHDWEVDEIDADCSE